MSDTRYCQGCGRQVANNVEDCISEVNYCATCGNRLEGDDFIITHQSHPYGSTTASEELLGGYRCHHCKTEEIF